MSLLMLVAMWLDNSLLNDTFDNDMLPTAQVQVEEKEKPSEPLSDRAASQLEKLSQQAPPHVTYSEARAAVSSTRRIRSFGCLRRTRGTMGNSSRCATWTMPWLSTSGWIVSLATMFQTSRFS